MPGTRAAQAAVVAPAALVPWVFTARADDVFYLPKLIVLWTVLLVAAWAVALAQGRPALPRWVPVVDRPVAAFTGWHVVALLLSTDPRQSLFGERLQHQGVLTLVLYLGWFWLARIVVRTPDGLLRLLRAVVLGAAGVCAYAVAQRFGHDPVWHGFLPAGRVFSTIGQSNALAAYLLMVLPCAVVLAVLATRPVVRAGWAAAAVLVLASMSFAQSRGALVGLAVVAPGLAWAVWRTRPSTFSTSPADVENGEQRSRRARWAAWAGVVVAVLVAIPLARPAVSDAWKRAQTAGEGGSELSVRNHLDIWKVAWHIAAHHPLAGTGPETFPDQFPTASREVLSPERVAFFDQFRVENAHNRLLAAADDAGVPGALAYLALLAGVGVALVRGAKRADSRAAALALWGVVAALAAHVVTDMFMTAEITGTWLFWMLAGAAVSAASAQGAQAPRASESSATSSISAADPSRRT